MPLIPGQLKQIEYSKNYNTHLTTESKHVYHIRGVDGIYGQYTRNKTHKHTLTLRCTSSPLCDAYMTIECPFTYVGGETKNTKFKLRQDVPESEFTDLGNWGRVSHKCTRKCVPRPNGMCDRTVHSTRCSTSSKTPTWNHPTLAYEMKKKREKDKVTPSGALAEKLIDQHKSDLVI